MVAVSSFISHKIMPLLKSQPWRIGFFIILIISLFGPWLERLDMRQITKSSLGFFILIWPITLPIYCIIQVGIFSIYFAIFTRINARLKAYRSILLLVLPLAMFYGAFQLHHYRKYHLVYFQDQFYLDEIWGGVLFSSAITLAGIFESISLIGEGRDFNSKALIIAGTIWLVFIIILVSVGLIYFLVIIQLLIRKGLII